MTQYVLLAVSILLTVLESAFYNHYAKAENPDTRGIFACNAVCYGAALISAVFVGLSSLPSVSTVLCAVLVCPPFPAFFSGMNPSHSGSLSEFS